MRRRLSPLLLLVAVAVPPGLAAPVGTPDDPCVDLNAAFENPTRIVAFDDECTFKAVVTFDRTENGFILMVTVVFADHTVQFVLECTKPEHLPHLGVPGRGPNELYAPCWDLDRGWA